MVKSGKILLGIFLFLAFIACVTLTTVDRSPIQDQDFFSNTIQRLGQTSFEGTEGGVWLSGWAKSNMTPKEPASLVGYAPRGQYEFVQDSSYVKAISLSNGKTAIAWLSYELLIVHPALAQQVHEAVKEAGLGIDQLIFTATHTHSGMGGYMPGPLGEFAFGGFDQEIMDKIVRSSVDALRSAMEAQDTVSITFRKSDAAPFVANRFVAEDPVDPYVRQLIFTKTTGKAATILTYSAHATCMSSKFMGLSGDYPYYLMSDLEAKGYDFALFASGTVGSHRPVSYGNTPELVKKYAAALDSTIRLSPSTYDTLNEPLIRTGQLPLSLREPHLRISDNLRIRPWLFDRLLGETNAHLDFTLIDNTLWIASSGEISGVFYKKWENLANKNGLNLIISTFNGGYIGYITPDEYYDRKYHEVREMNWYGPGNGQYFDELITRVILKAAQ